MDVRQIYRMVVIGLTITSGLLAAGEPIAVVYNLRSQKPRGGINWDCPVFAAYGDGTIIWRKSWLERVDSFLITKVDAPQLLTQRLAAVCAPYMGRIFRLTAALHAEATTIWISDSRLTIIGNWREPQHHRSDDPQVQNEYDELNAEETRLWRSLPPEIRECLAELESFAPVDATPWLPDDIVVSVSAAGPAAIVKGEWPPDLPSLAEAKVDESDTATLMVSSKHLPRILHLISTDGRSQAFMMNGRPVFAQIRFTFPQEKRWRTRD